MKQFLTGIMLIAMAAFIVSCDKGENKGDSKPPVEQPADGDADKPADGDADKPADGDAGDAEGDKEGEKAE